MKLTCSPEYDIYKTRGEINIKIVTLTLNTTAFHIGKNTPLLPLYPVPQTHTHLNTIFVNTVLTLSYFKIYPYNMLPVCCQVAVTKKLAFGACDGWCLGTGDLMLPCALCNSLTQYSNQQSGKL